MADDTIRQKLVFDAAQALEALEAVNEAADTAAGKAAILNKKLQDYSRSLGQNWKTTLAQMKEVGGAEGLRFTNALGKDVTDDVYKQAAALAQASQAKNKFVTEDTRAAAAEMNFDGSVRKVNMSLGEQSQRLQRLAQELNALKKPSQGRDAQGKFTSVNSFADQFKSVGSYSQQLRLVEKTISDLQRKTNLPFKDIGRELGKSFPELLKDTNLVSTAVQNLTKANQGLSASFRTEAESIQLVKNKLTELQAAGRLKAVKGGNNAQVENLKNVIRDVSTSTGAQYNEVAKQLEAMGVPAAQARAAVKGLNTELVKGARDAQGFSHGIDVIRTALGTLTAVGIFTALNAITEFFRGAIDQARQFEETLYRIGNAERQLSKAGIDVTVQGLRKGIDDIQKALPIFSKEDVSQLIGSLATTTKELGLAEDQILKLGAAVSILNINSTETESLLQTQAKVTNALISPQARSIGNLGLAFGKLKMEAKGAELGIRKSLAEMTDAEKTEIKFQIILETAGLENIDDISKLREEIQKGGGDFEALNEYLNSNTARLAANGAAWKDLQTTVGQVFLPLLPALTNFIEILTSGFNGLKVVIIEASAGFMGLVEAFRAFAALPISASLSEMGDAFKEGLTKGIDETRKELVNKFFPAGLPDSIKEGSLGDKLYGPLINPPRETATNPAELYRDAGEQAAEAVEDSEEKILDVMAEARAKREQIDENYRRKIEDANRDHAQKLQDIARDVARKQEDALRDYNQKVEDINRNADEDILKANQDYQQKEFEQEQEFQLKLKELRDEFLFDLEDALHERDARQVLRLIRRYNMDKQQLEERHKLEQQQNKIDLQQKLEQIERERQLKLEAARRELAEKQAEIQLWAEREREDAVIALQRKLADAREWHKRELIEYQQYLQQKLKSLADAIIKEYQLTAAGAQAIYNLLKGYFGGGGMIPNLLQNGLNANLNGILGGGNGGGWNSDTWKNLGFYGAAQGGNFIATRPTPLMVGEDGAEMVSVKPLTRAGSDTNKLFTSLGGGGQAGGMMNLRIALSDGLVAEIIDASLDGVAATIEKIGREK